MDLEWEVAIITLPMRVSFDLSENDLQGIFDISAKLVQAIGLAVYRASKPLTEVEGKL